ncbi:MAG: FlgD immunoglobulin-like domain containing protein [Candidatus Cloacimonadales bacterium]|nr:FlgD immunoglobulin-like domain containing protein [Candidatus Cloacimonadales bacterium]
MYNANDHLIPILWESGGPNPSPSYSTRGGLYSVGGVPHAEFGGTIAVVGGYPSTPMNYQPQYNSLINVNSPLAIDLSMMISGQNLILSTDVEVTNNITTTNNKVIFIITYNFDEVWFSTAVGYDQSTLFDLTSIGQTGNYEFFFPINSAWDIANLKGIVLVQSWGNNYQILQGASTMFTGLLPMFGSNITEGPAYLGVQFTNNSFPLTGIDSFEWDFDGDGTYDSTEENPYHLYTTPGVFDVTLRIGVGGEYAETTATDYITVTDGSNISGQLSGIWLPDFTYTITGDVNISATDVLSITPGTEIYIEDGAQFSVTGLLQADASSNPEAPIIFTSNSDWEGLRFMGSQANNVIANCEISKADVSAIRIENGSTVDIIGNKIFDDSSSGLGAAIEVTSSADVLISQNIIANNHSSNATGGIQCTNSPIEISNNILANNTGSYGAFILKTASDAILTNNTIANNEATGSHPHPFFIFNSAPIIKNCIIFDSNEIFYTSGTVNVEYTCISGGYEGTGNIDADPLFINPSGGDGFAFNGLNANWALQEGSPCIDAGDPDAMYNDLDGSRNDMGAYGGPNGMIPTGVNDDPIAVVSNSNINVYPNPFNPQTSIVLNMTELDKLHPVSVGIYNVKGQLVKTLVENEIVNHSTFIWNGTDNSGNNAATGMYFVKMKTSSSEIGKKILLLK